MNLISLVVVILRLMALNTLMSGIMQLFFWKGNFMRDSSDGYPGTLPWLLVGALVFCAVTLWVMALPIARLVTHGIPRDISFGSVSLADCYSIAFMGMGLFYLTRHLPMALNLAHFIFKASASAGGGSWRDETSGYEISQTFIPFILGVILFCKGRTWGVRLAQKQGELAGAA